MHFHDPILINSMKHQWGKMLTTPQGEILEGLSLQDGSANVTWYQKQFQHYLTSKSHMVPFPSEPCRVPQTAVYDHIRGIFILWISCIMNIGVSFSLAFLGKKLIFGKHFNLEFSQLNSNKFFETPVGSKSSLHP